MPQRFLKPAIRQSRRWNRCSFAAQSLFIRLLTLVDDFARYEADPELLRSEAFPYGDPDGNPITVDNICQQMTALVDKDMMVIYDVNGVKYLELKRWSERVRSEKSRFPAPPSHLPTVDSKCSLPKPSPPSSPKPSPAPPPPTTSGDRVDEILKTEGEISASKRVVVPSSQLSSEKDLDLSALQRIEERLNQVYKRPQTQRWDCDEEQTLVQVSKRVGVLDEMAHIFHYRMHMQEDDRKRFFPQSVRALLNNWGQTLDKARVQCPKPSEKKQQTKRPSNLKPFEQSEELAKKFREAAISQGVK